jgi:hypothetical protein
MGSPRAHDPRLATIRTDVLVDITFAGSRYLAHVSYTPDPPRVACPHTPIDSIDSEVSIDVGVKASSMLSILSMMTPLSMLSILLSLSQEEATSLASVISVISVISVSSVITTLSLLRGSNVVYAIASSHGRASRHNSLAPHENVCNPSRPHLDSAPIFYFQGRILRSPCDESDESDESPGRNYKSLIVSPMRE